MSEYHNNPQGLTNLIKRPLPRRCILQGAIALAAVVACAPNGLAAAASGAEALAMLAPPVETTLLLASDNLGESLEPGLWHGLGMTRVFDYVGGYLTRPNRSGQRHDPPEGGVAEQWVVSPDGVTYTFTLRPGLTFHDGTPVDAAAVVRSLTRLVNPADSSYQADCALHTNYTFNRRAISAPDPATVVIELERPDPAYLYRLFHPAAMILSPAALGRCQGGIQAYLVSCGPYQIERFVPNTEVTLIAFTGFWAGRPSTERVVIRAGVTAI